MTDVPDWLQAWLHRVTLWDILLWLSVLAFLVIFVKKGWPALRKFAARLSAFIRTVDAVVGLPEFISRTDSTLQAQDRKIAEIHHETHKNDGSSIKDSSDRTEAAVERVEIGVRGLYDRVDAVEETLAAVHGRLESVESSINELTESDEQIRERAEELRRDFDNTQPHPLKNTPKEKP